MDSNLQEQLKQPYHKISDVYGSHLRSFYRFLGGSVALALKNTNISPDTLTILSFILVLVSLPFFYRGIFPYNIIAGILLFLSMVLDKADGSLARIRKRGTPLGTWLDSTTDYFGIFLVFMAIAFHLDAIKGKPDYWILSMISYAMYNLSKLSYIFFKRYFKEYAESVVEGEKEKHTFRSSFHVNEVFVNNTILAFTLVGAFEALLIFLATYGTFFFIASYSIFTISAFKNNKIYKIEEELRSKF